MQQFTISLISRVVNCVQADRGVFEQGVLVVRHVTVTVTVTVQFTTSVNKYKMAIFLFYFELL